MFDDKVPLPVMQMLAHKDICFAFSNRRLVERLYELTPTELEELLSGPWPCKRLCAIAKKIVNSPQVLDRLIHTFGNGHSAASGTCATLISECDPRWRPPNESANLVDAAYRVSIGQASILETRCCSEHCSIGANLTNARLNHARISRGRLFTCRSKFSGFQTAKPGTHGTSV